MKKNVLFLISSLGKGGAEKVLINLFNKISDEKYDISICVVKQQGFYFKSIPPKVKTIVLFKNILLAEILNKIYIKFNINFFYKWIIRSKIRDNYEIVVSFADNSYTNLILLLKYQPEKKITWIHTSQASYSNYSKFYTEKYKDRVIRDRYSKMNSIIFVSNDSMNEFKSIFGSFPDMRVIYNVLDIENIKIRSKEFSPNLKGITNLIAVGSLLPVKGYDMLISACKILYDEGLSFNLLIFGDGPLKQILQTQINKLSLQETIILMGFESNPYPYILASDIFIMTSISEALPTSLCEAMILEKPVIVTNVAGCSEVVDNGKFGFLVNRSILDISDALRTLITNKSMRTHYSNLSKIRAQDFSDEHVLSKIDNLFCD